jgi:hypothetical protein
MTVKERKDLRDLHELTATAMGVAELQALAEETHKGLSRAEPAVASCSFTCGSNSCGATCVEQ